MLARLATVAVLWIAAQHALADARSILGSWSSDDHRTYYEVHFRPDHTFSLFARISMHNASLAAPQMGEQFGTWHIAGDRIALDSIERDSKRQFHLKLRFRLANHTLTLQRFYDPAYTDTYHRLSLPVCTELHSVHHVLPDEQALVGVWRGHYRTHDAEFVFQPNRHVAFYSWDLGIRRQFSEGTWRLKKDRVSMKAHGDADRISWRILHVGRRCMVVTDGTEMSYTLQRVQ